MADTGRDALLYLPSSKRIVLAAGMVRSGSTWLYNVARALLETNAPTYACWIDDFDPVLADPFLTALVKTHLIDRAVADHADVILATHRDVRDIAASARDMKWHNDDAGLVATAHAARLADEFWSPRAAVTIAYDDIVSRPSWTIATVASVLAVPCDARTAAKIAKSVDGLASPEAGTSYDKKNLLHPGHRSDGRSGRWRDTLDPKTAAVIEAQNRDWLVARGYMQP